MLREGKPAVNYENRGFHVGINRLSSSRSMTTNKWQRNHLRLVPRALLPCVVLILLGRLLTWLLHRLSCTAAPATPTRSGRRRCASSRCRSATAGKPVLATDPWLSILVDRLPLKHLTHLS